MKAHKTTPSPPPPYVSDTARLLRNAGGSIWFLSKANYGFVVKATIAGRILRVIFPCLAVNADPIPDEANSVTYIAPCGSDLADFRQLLQKISTN